jgi:hypothetical protein
MQQIYQALYFFTQTTLKIKKNLTLVLHCTYKDTTENTFRSLSYITAKKLK